MRLHRLEVESFGPFARREVIDFDALAEQGLFLLHGQTGSGKTSLLDAVCFALYGSVPGPRAKTERLTSDHAAAGCTPLVVCEFSTAERRFEVRRTPPWDRPKSRGTGTVRQQASVLVREWVDGEWVVRADRLDEAGLLLGDALGMAKDQFTKVVLLPQGDFAAFLRAGADDRRQLLEKLFGTARFTEVENWLADARNATRADLAAMEVQRGVLLARAEEHARDLPGYDPEHLAGLSALPPPMLDTEAVGLLHRWRDTAATAATTAGVHRGSASDELATAQQRLEHASESTRGAQRLRDLLQRRQALLATLPEHRDAADRAARAERAERIRPQLRSVEAAADALRDAEDRVNEVRQRVAVISPLLPASPTPHPDLRRPVAGRARVATPASRDQLSLDLDDLGLFLGDLVVEPVAGPDRFETCGLDLTAEIDARRSLTARLEALLSDEQGLIGDEESIADRARLIATLDEQVRGLAEAVQQGRLRIGALAEQQTRCAAVAETLPDRQQATEDARARAAAATQACALLPRLQTAIDEHQRAADAELAAREQHVALLAQRLDGMAAELASTLADGDPCPVCGAAEHPSPAILAAGEAISAATVEQARAAAEGARNLAQAASATRTGLATQHSAALAASGGLTPGAASAALLTAEQNLRAATEAADQLPGVVAAGTAARDRTAALEAESNAVRERRAATASELAQLRERAETVRARVATARAGYPTLSARVVGLAEEIEAMASLAEALHDLAQTRAGAERATAEIADLCAENGFTALDTARAALLSATELEQLTGRVRTHSIALDTATELLQQADSVAAADAAGLRQPWTAADTEQAALLREQLARHLQEVTGAEQQARAAHQAAELAATAAAQRELQLSRASEALAGLAGHLSSLMGSAAPLRERHAVLEELASTAHGLSASNSRRLRLSAFVLEARLEQVAAAASQRLQVMSDGRYTLLHSHTRSKGGGRSGLNLRVMDSWTSIERDTASLSGGESFLASLALALGLADVVQAEAGGLSFETLFIDEGFGTLDEDALELVMEVLDQLREGGRAVGVVSHVGELRSRIPAQVHVVKGQHGSSVRQVEALAG